MSHFPDDPISLGNYWIGHYHGSLRKSAVDIPRNAPVLAGRLVHSASGWGILEVPNALVRGAFDALDEQGIALPPSGPEGRLRAHISVFRKGEIAEIGGAEKISEWGKRFHYQLGPLQEVRPAGWDGVEKCWMIRVHSIDLERLRRSYGLSSLPNEGKFAFHVTIAIRRSGALRENGTSKAADCRLTDERGEPCPEGECCPHCGARLERGDDGDCNRCGKPWPADEKRAVVLPALWLEKMAPFQSQAQRRKFWATDPEMARRWEDETPRGKKLPERKRKKKTRAKSSSLLTIEELHGWSPPCRIGKALDELFEGEDNFWGDTAVWYNPHTNRCVVSVGDGTGVDEEEIRRAVAEIVGQENVIIGDEIGKPQGESWIRVIEANGKHASWREWLQYPRFKEAYDGAEHHQYGTGSPEVHEPDDDWHEGQRGVAANPGIRRHSGGAGFQNAARPGRSAAADSGTIRAVLSTNRYLKSARERRSKETLHLGDLEIRVEYHKGDERSGTSKGGSTWSRTMRDAYGRIVGSTGADGEQIDCYVAEDPSTDDDVHVVNQVDPDTGEFDEHKAMIGYGSEAEAREAYLRNYPDGWEGLGSVKAMPFDEFCDWCAAKAQRKAASDDEARRDYTRDHCPVCSEKATMACRCRRNDRTCKNGHVWEWIDGRRTVMTEMHGVPLDPQPEPEKEAADHGSREGDDAWAGADRPGPGAGGPDGAGGGHARPERAADGPDGPRGDARPAASGGTVADPAGGEAGRGAWRGLNKSGMAGTVPGAGTSPAPTAKTPTVPAAPAAAPRRNTLLAKVSPAMPKLAPPAAPVAPTMPKITAPGAGTFALRTTRPREILD